MADIRQKIADLIYIGITVNYQKNRSPDVVNLEIADAIIRNLAQEGYGKMVKTDVDINITPHLDIKTKVPFERFELIK